MRPSTVPFWEDELWALPAEMQRLGQIGRVTAAFHALCESTKSAKVLTKFASADDFFQAVALCGLKTLLLASKKIKQWVADESDDESDGKGDAVNLRSLVSHWPRRLRPPDRALELEPWLGSLSSSQDNSELVSLLRLPEKANVASAIYASGMKVFLESCKNDMTEAELTRAGLSIFSAPVNTSAHDDSIVRPRAAVGLVTCAVVFSLLSQSPVDALVATLFPSPEMQTTISFARVPIVELGEALNRAGSARSTNSSGRGRGRMLLAVAAELAPLVCHHLGDTIVMEPKARFYPAAVALQARMEKLLEVKITAKRQRQSDQPACESGD